MERAQKSRTELYRLGNNTLTALRYDPLSDLMLMCWVLGLILEKWSSLPYHFFHFCFSGCLQLLCFPYIFLSSVLYYVQLFIVTITRLINCIKAVLQKNKKNKICKKGWTYFPQRALQKKEKRVTIVMQVDSKPCYINVVGRVSRGCTTLTN